MRTDIRIDEAMEVVIDRLKKDADYWDHWEGLIAGAYYDENEKYAMGTKIAEEAIARAAHDGARRFLNMLTRKTEQDGQ